MADTCPSEPIVYFLEGVNILGICALSLEIAVPSGIMTDSCLDNIFYLIARGGGVDRESRILKYQYLCVFITPEVLQS